MSQETKEFTVDAVLAVMLKKDLCLDLKGRIDYYEMISVMSHVVGRSVQGAKESTMVDVVSEYLKKVLPQLSSVEIPSFLDEPHKYTSTELYQVMNEWIVEQREKFGLISVPASHKLTLTQAIVACSRALLAPAYEASYAESVDTIEELMSFIESKADVLYVSEDERDEQIRMIVEAVVEVYADGAMPAL